MLRNNKEEMMKLLKEKGESVIPKKTCYCYERLKQRKDNPMRLEVIGQCPYLDHDPEQPEQYDGYCWFLQKGDWEMNGEKELVNQETGEVMTGDEIGIPVSLLWDMVKECGIDTKEDEENYI